MNGKEKIAISSEIELNLILFSTITMFSLPSS